jgi:hypothetical protein
LIKRELLLIDSADYNDSKREGWVGDLTKLQLQSILDPTKSPAMINEVITRLYSLEQLEENNQSFRKFKATKPKEMLTTLILLKWWSRLNFSAFSLKMKFETAE